MIRAAARHFPSRGAFVLPSAASARSVQRAASSTAISKAPLGYARTAGRTALIGVGGSIALGGAGTALYLQSDDGAGLNRQLTFWSYIGPVVLDYTWNLSSRSPLVQYQDWTARRALESEGADNADLEEEFQKQRKVRRAGTMAKLHQQHAPDLFQCLLELKGLYVKFGQVLSVSTLPVPDQYRELFKKLQSDVPGHEDFDSIILPVLERDFGAAALQEVFESIDPIPCGAASIGQAHKATIRRAAHEDDPSASSSPTQTVIIKVQYPDAKWQVPADIISIGQFMDLCVYFDVIDESSAKMSYEEFSRQFLAELDYDKERRNLEAVYESSLDPNGPYQKYGVLVPKVLPELCSPTVLTMTYLPGPKMEEEARRRLEDLGINTKTELRSIAQNATKDFGENQNTNNDGGGRSEEQTEASTNESALGTQDASSSPVAAGTTAAASKKINTETKHGPPAIGRSSVWPKIARMVGNTVGFDSILWAVRFARQLMLWSTAVVVKGIDVVADDAMPTRSLVPSSVKGWAAAHQTAAQQAQRISMTRTWIQALFEVHGHQIFELGLFNADPHPGNILVIDTNDAGGELSLMMDGKEPQLGLIDFGQCKQLRPDEQFRVANLLLSVANNDSDEVIAAAFRAMEVKTKNDSTEFLANFAKLMFGRLEPFHLDHDWHKEMHKKDAITYFPNELGMVYRTSMLLRGLAVSLQWNLSVGDMWKDSAQSAVSRYQSSISERIAEELAADNQAARTDTAEEHKARAPPEMAAAALMRRSTRAIVNDVVANNSNNKEFA